MARQLVVYMTPWCGGCRAAQRWLDEWGVSYRHVNIAQDRAAAAKVRAWTGFESVPTLVIAEEGSGDPADPPLSLAPGQSPSGIDRGSLLTEPSRSQLQAWLLKHGLLQP